jgi:predicted nucleotidyltransferase
MVEPNRQLVTQLETILASFDEVRLALLFGSQAKGRATSASDVDLAVLSAVSTSSAVAAKVSDAIGREVDVVSLADPTIPLLRELIRDGIVVYERRAGEGALWRSRTLAQLEVDGPWYDRMRDAWIARVAQRGLSSGQ